MAQPRQHARQDDELFMPGAITPDPGSPTVGPLRIHRAHSPQSTSSSRAASAQNDYDEYDDYQQPPRSKPPVQTQPPYPDDRPRVASRQDTSRREMSSAEQSRSQNMGAEANGRRAGTPQTRFKFGADDPNRPSLSGHSHPQISTTSRPVDDSDRTPKPLPESPGPETPDKDEEGPAYPRTGRDASHSPTPYPEYEGPPRPVDTTASQLHVPDVNSVNRLASTASVSTTRASRGSPPPPETPVDKPGGNRWAAATPPPPATASIHSQGAAASQRASPYAQPTPKPATPSPARPYQQAPSPAHQFYQPPLPAQRYQQSPSPAQQQQQRQQTPPQTSWSPPLGHSESTQRPIEPQGNDDLPFGITQQPTPEMRQGAESAQPDQSQSVYQGHSILSGAEMQRLNLHEEPPPAYSTVPGQAQRTTPSVTGAQNYQNDKRMSFVPQAYNGAQSTTPIPMQDPNLARHPAFALDQQQQQQSGQSISPSHPAAAGLAPIQIGTPQAQQSAAAGPSMNSPPPLPEGWIAHMDQNSGHYYYIHLPTQSTQWEFPKGPTPLNMQEPMSPVGSIAPGMASPAFSAFQKPMASPAFAPAGYQTQYAGYQRESMASMASPTATTFTGPPPSAGVDMYKVVPSNGVYFGPYLRYTNVDLERSLWLGSIMLITDMPQPPTIHIHQSVDLSPSPRQLKANPIYSHQRWLFYRYDIDLIMEEQPTKWTYAITSHLGCTRYEFLIAGRYETSWRFITHSNNDFALSVNANERAKLGGVNLMWKDVLQKHQECGGFHAQLGLGGQIYADRLWQDVPALRQWTTMSGKENRRNAPWSAKHEEDVIHAYFHYYTSHFDQPHLREAFAQIPHVLQLDDHDIFDGFGSYPDYMQHSHMFKNIGRIGIDMYLLFQHHTTHEILRNVNNDLDLFTITGSGWHFLKYLGPAVVVVGPDTRSERTHNQVMAGPTYQGLFPKVATLPPSVQHCIWMIPVPLIYPRLHSAQQIANTVTHGKKAVTGTFNMLGKVTSSVAGIVGAKEVVNDGFASVKKAVGKSGLMSGMLNPFGELDVLDELRDMWTHESKDLERTYIIRTLQGIAHNKSLRMTFLSGSVNCAGAGLVHDPAHPSDHKTMYQLISSAIVNAPPSSMVLRLLNTNPKNPIYIPQNGRRSNYSASAQVPAQATDTKEDMMEIFVADPNGAPREMKRLMGRRNYVAMVAYDPEVVQGTFGNVSEPKGSGRLSLAADFLVQQGEGYGGSVKYGPVVIPSLEYGR